MCKYFLQFSYVLKVLMYYVTLISFGTRTKLIKVIVKFQLGLLLPLSNGIIGLVSLINLNALLKCYHSFVYTHSDQSHETRHPVGFGHFSIVLCVFWIDDRRLSVFNFNQDGKKINKSSFKILKLSCNFQYRMDLKSGFG